MQLASRVPDAAPSRPLAWGALLAVLILCAALLREFGIGFHLPTAALVDERVYVEQLEAFETLGENPATLPRAGYYPYLVSRLSLATWRLTGAPSLQPTAESGDVSAHLVAASAVQLHIRRVVAWLSLLVIPGTWFLVRAAQGRLGSRPVAFGASALVASSILLQIYAQEGRPHGAFLGVALIAIVLAVRVLERPSFARVLSAGAAGGIAFTILQTGLFLLAPIGTAILLARDVSWRRRAELVLVLVLPFALAFAWGYPFLFVGQERDSEHEGHALLGAGHFGTAYLSGRGFAVFADTLWTYEPILCGVLVLGGAWLGLRAWRARPRANRAHSFSGPGVSAQLDRRRLLVLASFPIAYLLVFGAYEFTWPRYATVLVPFAAWAAAWLLVPGRSPSRPGVAWLPFVCILGIEAGLVLQLARVRSRPDTSARAARWIEEHLPPSARLATLVGEDLPLLRTPEQRQWFAAHPAPPFQPWLGYQGRLGSGAWDASARDVATLAPMSEADTAGELERSAAEYVVVQRPGNPLRRDRLRVHAALTRDATRLAVFHPTEDEEDARPFDIRDQMDEFPREGFWIGRLVRARCLGATVEVWKRLGRH